jgi:parallel beta-helix repeat protein
MEDLLKPGALVMTVGAALLPCSCNLVGSIGGTDVPADVDRIGDAATPGDSDPGGDTATGGDSEATQPTGVTMPIGIPPPEFGLTQTHKMYEQAQYDFGEGLEAYRNAGNGPYTHYIDNRHVRASDAGNPFGTPDRPRATIPHDLGPGSVVEVHNGPYDYTESVHGGTYLPILNASGTAERPIFIRGASRDDRFEIGSLAGNNSVLLRRISYVVIENALINGPALKIYQPTDHVAIRHCEITGEQTSGINIWTYKIDFTAGHLKQHLVIFDNEIHDNGEYPASAETGKFGIMLDNATENVWVIDNTIYHNGDDGIQIIDRDWVPALADVEANRIFIGRNLMHHDGENAIDVKGSRNVILSQNEVYGYRRIFSSSAGEAIRINDEGAQNNIWVIFNHIYDSTDGIDPVGALFYPYVIGNVIHDVEMAVNQDAMVVTNNTIYNCGTGVARRSGPHDELSNNIIVSCDNPYQPCPSCGPDATHTNILFANATSRSCTGCKYDDPLLRDIEDAVPANTDAHLRAGSPAIDSAGSLSPAYDVFSQSYGIDIRRDIEGVLRPPDDTDWDIGAYEADGS